MFRTVGKIELGEICPMLIRYGSRNKVLDVSNTGSCSRLCLSYAQAWPFGAFVEIDPNFLGSFYRVGDTVSISCRGGKFCHSDDNTGYVFKDTKTIIKTI